MVRLMMQLCRFWPQAALHAKKLRVRSAPPNSQTLHTVLASWTMTHGVIAVMVLALERLYKMPTYF